MKENLKLIKLTDTHYIVIDDFLIKDVRPYVGRYHYEKGVAINQFPTYLTDLSECNLIIYSTEPLEGVENISLKNCQEIELGYNLDELASTFFPDSIVFNDIYVNGEYESEEMDLIPYQWGFKVGFKKAIELFVDKKFTEEDLRKAYQKGEEDSYLKGGINKSTEDECVKLIQQREWDVEIVMSPCIYDDSLGGFSTSYKEGKPIEQPKIDSSGCIILKPIKK